MKDRSTRNLREGEICLRHISGEVDFIRHGSTGRELTLDEFERHLISVGAVRRVRRIPEGTGILFVGVPVEAASKKGNKRRKRIKS
jgi:hypothetical protein